MPEVDSEVSLFGWVDRRRDHGGVIFIDLRDREGIVQVVFDPDAGEHFALADKVRSEYVLHVQGVVRARSAETINADMATGQIEVYARTVDILNQAETPPFQLDEFTDVGEDVRLKYRYLDLRRNDMQQNFVFVRRCRLIFAVFGRKWLFRYRNTYFNACYARGSSRLFSAEPNPRGQIFCPASVATTI